MAVSIWTAGPNSEKLSIQTRHIERSVRISSD
jgi:hypothetical protein